jgi:hypothetical protein
LRAAGLGVLIDNGATLPAVLVGPIGMDLPILISFVLNDPACLRLFDLATRAAEGAILAIRVVANPGPPAPSSVSAIGSMSLVPALVAVADGSPLPATEVTGDKVFGGCASFTSVAMASICGAMLCHEFEISAMDPYSMSKSVRLYRTSSAPARTLRWICSTPTILVNTLTQSLHASSTPRQADGGGVPRRHRLSNLSRAPMRVCKKFGAA